MKRILAILTMIVAFAGTALAWDPVIKETHWFGQYEYQDYNGPFTTKQINFVDGNFIESIVIAKTWAGPDVTQHPKTSFYSWIDHQLRFKVNITDNWSLDRNGNGNYNGLGLYNQSGGGTCFWICNLKAGDKFNIEYYRENTSTSPFLAAQGGALTSVKDEDWNTTITASEGYNDASAIYGARNGELIYYTVEEDGDVAINIPSHTVIRSVSIILNNEQYQTAEGDVEPLQSADLQKYLGSQYNTSSFGYRYAFTKSGVLEDKRGAVPYITMKYGADNDMTFVRKLSDGGQVTTYNDVWQDVTPQVYSKDRGENGYSAPDTGNSDQGPYYLVTNDPSKDTDTSNSDSWEAQFWIGNSSLDLHTGDQFKVHFVYRANHHDVTGISTQMHAPNPGDYQTYEGVGNFDMNTGWWQSFDKTVSVSENQAGLKYIAINLNPDNQYNEYWFADIQIQVLHREEVTTQSEGEYGAASIIDASNNLDPATDNYDYLQYRWTYKQTNNLDSKFTNEEIRNRLVGKEWSTFTAKHDYTVDAGLSGTRNSAGEEIVYGDKFLTIFPLCGNFFYFYPEVDGKLVVEYYCEGVDETPAFWFKTDADGNQMTVNDQSKANCQHFLANGQTLPNGRTNGTNNYYLTADVKSGCVYYFCSLPTNMSHERPIVRLKAYSFIPKFRVEPLYKVVDNVTAKDNNSNELKYAAEIFGGPYTGQADPTDNLNTEDLNTYQRAEDPAAGQYYRNKEAEPRVKCLGNVASATPYVFVENGRQFLGFKNIVFKDEIGTGKNADGDTYNRGGAVVAHINNKGGQASFVLTIAYDAAEAKMKDGVRVPETAGATEVKRWDFFTDGDWNLGKYGEDDGTRFATNESGWRAKSKLFKEIHKADGETQDWSQTYVTLKEGGTGIEPIFKSVYDMEGDNADMIHETAGLVFHTAANHVGVYNENGASTKTSFQDRFIGFMEDGQLVIPFLKENDRLVLKLGCYGNVPGDEVTTQQMKLKITGAKDATGKEITTSYFIGGSGAEVGNGTDMRLQTLEDMSQPWGEYHFMAIGPTSDNPKGDVTIELEEGELLKIYSIAIYRNEKDGNNDVALDDQIILTENQVMGDDDKRYILNLQENSESDYALLYLNHRGLIEPTDFHQETRMTGNFEIDPENDRNDVVVSSGHTTNDAWYNYTVQRVNNPDNAKFGIFKTRMGVKTLDGKYVTDYAECMVPVGYRQIQEYPYTWDFTDLRSSYVNNQRNATVTAIDANGGELEVDNTDLMIWNGWNFRSAPEKYDGYLFAPGGQLYSGKTMWDETRGIGVIHNGENGAMSMNNPKAQNGKGDGGFAVSGGNTFEFVVPQVPENAAVYVHARKVNGASASTVQRKLKKANEEEPSAAANFIFSGTDSNGDDVFALKNTELANVHICVQGYEVNKIAVATDAKKVNVKGYASESRNHMIDAKLLPYFTGKPLKTFVVGKDAETGKEVDYDNLKITLIDIAPETANYVMPANTGCVIYNDEKCEFNPFVAGEVTAQTPESDKGFHLFVPDMHDQGLKEGEDKSYDVTTNNKFMVEAVAGIETPQGVPHQNVVDGVDMTSYVLSYKYYKLVGSTVTGPFEGDEKFYRVYSGKPIKLRPNSAYLQLPTAEVSPSGDAANAPNRAPSFRFNFDFNDYMRGDVNADQTVDVADFIGTANYILGNTPESFVFKAADLNKDYGIDVADFIGIANIILGKNTQSHAMNRAAGLDDTQDDALYVEPFDAVPGTRQVISVRMNNSVPVAGYEFNLRLPEGITVARDANGYMAELSTERTNERRTNFFGTAMQADGTLKVLCGTSNADNYGLFTFDGSEGEVARVTVNIPENYKRGMSTATVTDARYTDLEGQLYFFGTTTGISDIAVTFNAEPDTYYTLSGQKLDGRPAQRGFYILNGKKVLVK